MIIMVGSPSYQLPAPLALVELFKRNPLESYTVLASGAKFCQSNRSILVVKLTVYGCFLKWWVFPPNHPFS